jgi:hypothetical protein
MGSAGDATSTASSNLPAATTEKNPANDLGPSVFVGDGSESAAAGSSGVAEIASRYKAEKGTRNARVLSNEDVQRMLNDKSGVTMARNMPPLGPGSIEQSGRSRSADVLAGSTQSAQPVPQETQTTASASQQGQNGMTGQVGAAPAAFASQNQSAAETSADNATTPQINRNQQTNDAQGSRRLPATATFLPLLGLLGLASGGIGLCFRKFRK